MFATSRQWEWPLHVDFRFQQLTDDSMNGRVENVTVAALESQEHPFSIRLILLYRYRFCSFFNGGGRLRLR